MNLIDTILNGWVDLALKKREIIDALPPEARKYVRAAAYLLGEWAVQAEKRWEALPAGKVMGVLVNSTALGFIGNRGGPLRPQNAVNLAFGIWRAVSKEAPAEVVRAVLDRADEDAKEDLP